MSHPWYHTARWLRQRERQLRKEPLCAYCKAEGRIALATVADHVVPHRGNRQLFFHGQLQSLCQVHHSGAKQVEEVRGFGTGVGKDGLPLDRHHPTYTGRLPGRLGYSIPQGLEPSAIPVHVVCGSPGSGKTTYVRERANPGDVVVDLDDIIESLGGVRYTDDVALRKRAMVKRADLLYGLANRDSGIGWVIVVAPTIEERMAWKKALGKLCTVHVLGTTRAECLRRIEHDPQRQKRISFHRHLVDTYFRTRT